VEQFRFRHGTVDRTSGRSFNNPAASPIFPWVAKDYESATLNLNNSSVFRDLTKPIVHLSQRRLDVIESKRDHRVAGVPFLYFSSSISTPLCIFLCLLRMEPFATLHIALQNGKFDHAARLFASIRRISEMVTTRANDFRELIPEFFCQPEVLANANGFDLGLIHGAPLSDVALPAVANRFCLYASEEA
jgi:hypothetical protein